MKKPFNCEDLTKSLSLYHLNRHLKKRPIEKYHRQIDSSALHEREKYRKKSEILLMNAFMHHFPEVKFENITCESPDFIATVEGKTIGIELSEVINHLEIKKVENLMNRIFRQAEMLLETEDTARFRGVYFLHFEPLSLHDLTVKQDEIIQNICKCIRKDKPSGVVRSLRKSRHRRNVFITHDYNLNLFDSLPSEKILEIIHKKNEKFPFYDSSVDECWLVVVSDMNSLASRFSFIQNREELHEVKSPFDRIFHMENLCGNLVHIK